MRIATSLGFFHEYRVSENGGFQRDERNPRRRLCLRNCSSCWQLCPRSLTWAQIYEAALHSQEEERMNNGAPGSTQWLLALFAVVGEIIELRV